MRITGEVHFVNGQCHMTEELWNGHRAALNFAQKRIAELERRLEIDPEHGWDGIAARDETIKQLENRLYECQDELRNRTTDVDSMVDEVNKYVTELAAAQATIQQKDEALEQALDALECYKHMSYGWHGKPPHEQPRMVALDAINALRAALALPADRSCLDAMLAEAEKRGMLKAAEICGIESDGYGGIVEGPIASERGKQVYQAMAAGAANCADAIRQAAERTSKEK